jgi:DNA-directed RNA polymerase specialized sigma24 family protein
MSVEPSRADRFETLFRENYAAVRAYALRRTARDVGQDVVAETSWRVAPAR